MAKKQKTFADRAKQIMNKYKSRLGENFDKGDILALEAMNQELEALRQEQEAVREQMMMEEASQTQGLPLHAYGDFLGEPNANTAQINPTFLKLDQIFKMKEGLDRDNEFSTVFAGMQDYPSFINAYNEYAGKPMLSHRYDEENKSDVVSPYRPPVSTTADKVVQKQAAPVTGSVPIVQNMGERSKLGQWLTGQRYRMKKTGMSGDLPMYDDGGLLSDEQLALLNQPPPPLQSIPGIVNTTAPKPDFGQFNRASYRPSFRDRMDVFRGKLGSLGMQEGDLYKSRVPWMGAAAGIVGNLLMNKQLDLPTYDYQEYTPERATANLVNFGREREQVMQERDLANQQIMGVARGSGSMSSLMENIQAGATGTQREAGRRFGESLQNEGTANAQILNQISQFNAAQGMRANEMNERNRMFASNMLRENAMINADRRDSRIKGIIDNISGLSRDKTRADQYDTSLHLAAPENTEWQVGQDSWLRRLFGVSPRIKRATVNTEKDALLANANEVPGINAYGGDLMMISTSEYNKLMKKINKPTKKK